VAMFAFVVRNPGGQDFLQGSKTAGCEHLGAQRVTEVAGGRPTPLEMSVSRRLLARHLDGRLHTARYPVWLLPPVNLCPISCERSCLRPPGIAVSLTVSFSNLTDMMTSYSRKPQLSGG
jgi:hypothetical protein